jgi:hypothetical protein
MQSSMKMQQRAFTAARPACRAPSAAAACRAPRRSVCAAALSGSSSNEDPYKVR